MPEKEAPLPPLPLEWEPLRRSAPKVGRNDPCPCGSGKKYKKCCEAKDAARGSDLSPFAGMTKAEALADPGRHGDVRVVDELLSLEQLDALDPSRLTTAQVQAMAARAGREGRPEAASRALAELDGRADAKGAADEYRCDVVSLFVRAKAVDAAEAELAKVPADHPRRSGAALSVLVARRSPDALAHLDALLGKEPDEPNAFIDAAYSLHDAGLAPLALALLRATPVDVLHVEDAKQLALEADDIRKALKLPEGDPVLDPALVAYDRAHPEAELAGTKRALEETERARAKLAEQKAALAEVLRERAEAESALAKARQEAALTAAAKRPVDADGDEALRRKIEQMKAEMREQQRERAELRERVRELEAELQKGPGAQPAAEPADAGADDAGEELPSERPMRAAVFGPLFHDTARTIDPKVVLKAQEIVLRFAGYDDSAWHQAKKMRDLPDVFTLRVGIHHRVILRRSSDGGVEARELVTREAFDATLRGYRR